MALLAGMHGSSRADAARRLENMGFSRADALRGASAWDQTGIGYGKAAKSTALAGAIDDGVVFNDRMENGVFKTGMQQQEEAIAHIAGTDNELAARLTGMAYAGNKAHGRFEMSDGFGDMYGRVQRLARGEQIAPEEFNHAITEAMRGTSNTQLSSSKGRGMQSGTQALAEDVRFMESVANGTASAAEMETAARILGTVNRDANGNVTGINAADTVTASRQAMVQAAEKIENLKATGIYMPEIHVATVNRRASVPSASAVDTVHNDADFRSQPTPPINAPAGSNRVPHAGGPPIGRTAGDVSDEQRQSAGRLGGIDPGTGRPWGT
jgi:hypothetical protein